MSGSTILPPSHFQDLLPRFQRLKQSRKGWFCCCPAHDDKRASCSIGIGSKGQMLLKCHAGCSLEDILAAIGISKQDLYPPKSVHSRPASRSGASGRCIVKTYLYRDEKDALLYEVVRYEPKDFRQRRPDGADGWIWNLGEVRRVLYCLPELMADVEASQTIFIAEGEKDVDRLRQVGLAATCNMGGASKWRPEYSPFLKGAHVVLLEDNDEAGRKHVQVVAGLLNGIANSVKILRLPGLPEHGDVSDWLDSGGTVEELQHLAEATPQWEPEAMLTTVQEAMVAQAQADLLGMAKVTPMSLQIAQKPSEEVRHRVGKALKDLLLKGNDIANWWLGDFYRTAVADLEHGSKLATMNMLLGPALARRAAKCVRVVESFPIERRRADVRDWWVYEELAGYDPDTQNRLLDAFVKSRQTGKAMTRAEMREKLGRPVEPEKAQKSQSRCGMVPSQLQRLADVLPTGLPAKLIAFVERFGAEELEAFLEERLAEMDEANFPPAENIVIEEAEVDQANEDVYNHIENVEECLPSTYIIYGEKNTLPEVESQFRLDTQQVPAEVNSQELADLKHLQDAINADFEAFWSAYPLQENKQAAKKAYQQAREGKGDHRGYALTTHTEIMDGLSRWQASIPWQRPECIQPPQGWLDRRLWESTPLTVEDTRTNCLTSRSEKRLEWLTSDEYLKWIAQLKSQIVNRG